MKAQAKVSELRQALMATAPKGWLALLFGGVASLLMLAPSVYMLEVYDRVVNSRDHVTLVMLTVLVLGAFITMQVLEWVRSEVLREGAEQFDRTLSNRVFGAMFTARIRQQAGGTTQVMQDLRTLREFFYSGVPAALVDIPAAFVFLLVVFWASPVLGWVTVMVGLLQALLARMNERRTQPPLKRANDMAAASRQYAEAAMTNAEVVESMGMLGALRQQWLKRQQAFLDLQAQASDAAGRYQSMSKMVQLVMGSLLLGLGAYLLLRGELNGGSGMMIVASILGGRVLAPITALIGQWRLVVNFRDAWGRLERLLQDVPLDPRGMPLPPPKGQLTVEGVIAMSPGRQQTLLRGVQFQLAPGEVLAVVGPSASGKTTLARLLVGVWPSMGGKVRLDGADVYTWSKDELGPYVGYLPQGVELIDGTVAENIARFAQPDMERVRQAVKSVGLDELIEALPNGYDTLLGRSGHMLSGGQRQRLGLARALYGQPSLVVLDEPNSSLDEAGDAALALAIAQLKVMGTTFVVITHRTSVLKVADKMLVLKDGQQQHFGATADVMNALRNAQAAPTSVAMPAAPSLISPQVKNT